MTVSARPPTHDVRSHDLPLFDMPSLYAALEWRAAHTPDKPFVKSGEQWRSFAEIDYLAKSFATGLAGCGVRPGDTVAHISPNREELIISFFACAYLGAINVSMNIYLRGEFLRHQLDDSGATVLVADASAAATAAPMLSATAIRHLVLLGDSHGADKLDLPDEISVARFGELTGEPSDDLRATTAAADTAGIVYTSGTTGPSKGCALSNGYYLRLPAAFLDFEWVVPGDRIYTALPLFHLAAQVVLLKALTIPGVSAVITEQFSASRFMRETTAEHATVVWGMGPMAALMLAQPDGADDREHSLRLAIWHSASRDVLDRWEARFAAQVVGSGYGQTEATGVTLATPSDTAARGTMGKPCPHFEYAIVDDADRPVPIGEVGELIVRPRHPLGIYSGYWGNPAATVETWRNLWHHTGDFVREDAHGYISFADRKKDAVRRRGENVSSFELEAAIARHPDIARVAITAVQSPVGDDDIKVSIIARNGASIIPGQMYDFFAKSLPYFAIPRYLDVRDSMPLTPTDRVQKHLLRAEGVTPSMSDFEAMGLTVSRDARR
jgi:carnitine-CoA ligase